ncbi:MAG: NUMOD4 motif-containing HNH endonuclease [Desulfitobacteriaceae bacterium]
MKKEIWKDIPGYEGRYQASSLGRIKSLSRKVRGENPYTGREFMRTIPERILRPGRYCSGGHLSVVLGHGEAGVPVHQLIMLTFVGTPPDDMEVLHNNGDPMDNRIENLRYGTRTENILDVYRQGGRWRKLSTEEVETIRFSLFCGIRGVDIARKFDVSQSTISKIKLGRTFWWHA